MDRTKTTGEDRKALRCIAAVLLALAGLAERAGDRPLAVRCLVLWLLRSGEVSARDYLVRLTGHDAWPSEPCLFTHDPGEAIHLAVSFRRLAAALADFTLEDPAPRRQAVAARYGSCKLGALAASDPLAAYQSPATAVARRDSS